MPLIKRLSIALAALALVCGFAASSAFASTNQVSVMQDNNAIAHNPVKALAKMKAMGVTVVKYAVYWRLYAPNAYSTRAPRAATDPSAYGSSLNSLIAIDEAAHAVGIKLGFMVTAPVPRWAEGGGCPGFAYGAGTCRPNDRDFQTFMVALGRAFDGANPAIPAVRWWSIWNEPNYIPNIAPQMSGPTYSAPDIYRGLLNAGWHGLAQSGHTTRGDTILWGDLAPRGISGGNRGEGPAENGAGYKPVAFLAALYCENLNGRRFGGRFAAQNGCGKNPRAFRNANPALFNASGVSDHPYSQGLNPTVKTGDCTLRVDGRNQSLFCPASRAHPADPLWTDLASISNLENALFRDLRTYGSHKRYPIWNTEFGYWTRPPGRNGCSRALPADCSVNQNTAAFFLNWAEYVSYRNPRIASLSQYQLYDPYAAVWTDGLLTGRGAPKPAYAAWEVPLFLPRTVVPRKGDKLFVWGGARPASVDAAAARGFAPRVAIQEKAGRGRWITVQTVGINPHSAGGYFTTSVPVRATGLLRLVYRFRRTTLVSRTQVIRVR